LYALNGQGSNFGSSQSQHAQDQSHQPQERKTVVRDVHKAPRNVA
jgi:hypothetical protein